MANIDKELSQIKNAVYGKDVRGSIHDGIEKINNESEDSKQKANEAHDVMENIINDGFDNAALEANFEQKLDDKINNLQPEWTGFKDDVTSQLAETDNQLDYLDQEVDRKRDKSTKIVKSDYDLSQDVNRWNINDLDEETRQAILEGNDIDINYVLGKDSVTRENYSDESVYPEKTSFAKSKNLARLVKNLSFSGGFGNWTFTQSEGAYSYVAKVVPGESYTISSMGDSDRFRIATNIGYPSIGEVVDRHVTDLGSGSDREYTFSMLPGHDYIIVYVATAGTLPPTAMQVEIGINKSEYAEPGKEVTIDFAKGSIPLSALESNVIDDSERRIFIADNAAGNYYSDPELSNPYGRNLDLIYEKYDAMTTDFSNYVTKTSLGVDEGGKPLHRYDFKPLGIKTGADFKFPKIIYTATHGHESAATYAGSLFFDDLCRNWRSNPVLRILRWNIHFIVIPNLNPWGFVENSRTNYNGVDLARNFSAEWVYDGEGTSYFSGDEPLSEFGSQQMDLILQENRDALFAIDHHNFAGDPYEDDYLLWVGTLDDDAKKIGEQYMLNIIAHMRERQNIPEDIMMGKLQSYENIKPGSLVRQFNKYKIPGLIIENTWRVEGSWEKGQILNIDSIGNAALAIINFFKNK